MTVTLAFHGATRTVTGSCMLLGTPDARVLIDCGMFQGPKTLKELNYGPFPFDPGSLDAVILTHAHIDHSGLLPKLIRAGFQGPIHATGGTRDLCSAMLPDSGHIQQFEVEVLNRRNARRGHPQVTPIYTAEDGVAAMRSFRTVAREHWFAPARGFRARLWNAGHILGSTSLEVEVDAGPAPLRLLFSGDLGPHDSALERQARAPSGFDYVVCESTYGGTDRPDTTRESRRAWLAGEVRGAMEAGGALLIPAFAVERTQELVIDLVALMEEGDLPELPIFIDSPLAIRATRMFVRNAGELPGSGNIIRRLAARNLRFTQREAESRRIARQQGFHIVLAGSGMCDAGRIRHHLRNWLWKSSATVLLTGFQAQGTLGRLLLDGARAVRIQGDEIDVRARIRATDAYSGHADRPDLLAWIAARQPIRAGLFLVHGEDEASAALAASLPPGPPVLRPSLDDLYALTPEGAELRNAGRPRRIDPGLIGRLDWHNERSRLILDIGARLDRAPDDAARAALLRRLRAALEALPQDA
jgi:metallo-beta-lactamase family protein